MTFAVTDGAKSVGVDCVGACFANVPDLFREGQGVVAEGALAASGRLSAEAILAKHDERYMPREVVDAAEARGPLAGRDGQAMIVEAGHFALILAFALSLAQSIAPLVGARRGDASLMAVGTSAALGQFVFVALAFAALAWAHLASDFSVLNVAENSHSAAPAIYKFSGVWGNHEGSMLLWSLILAIFGAIVAVFGRSLPARLRADALAVQGMIGAAFLAFILLTSNPFERLSPAPVRGPGPQPDPAGPRPRDPSAAALPRLCRLLDRLLLRRRGADRGADRRRLGALRPAVRADRLVLPDARHRRRLVLGLLHARLGRLLVLGPGRERLADAVARRHRLRPFGGGDGEARRAEGVDDLPRHPGLLASRCSAPSWCARAC